MNDNDYWNDRLQSEIFVTFYNPKVSLPDVDYISLVDVTCDDGKSRWVLLHNSETVLHVYSRVYRWDDGAKPPMSNVMSRVYETFGL